MGLPLEDSQGPWPDPGRSCHRGATLLTLGATAAVTRARSIWTGPQVTMCPSGAYMCLGTCARVSCGLGCTWDRAGGAPDNWAATTKTIKSAGRRLLCDRLGAERGTVHSPGLSGGTGPISAIPVVVVEVISVVIPAADARKLLQLGAGRTGPRRSALAEATDPRPW